MALVDLSTVEYKSVKDIMKDTIETGFYDYDKHIFDLKKGEITILFGRDGEGKSNVASQIIAHHINQGKRAYLFSGELSKNKIQLWLYRQIVGEEEGCHRIIETKYGDVIEIKPQVVELIKKWHEAKLSVHETQTDNIKGAEIFTDIEHAAAVGYDLFVIDNLMAAFDADAISQYADQANFVQRCKDYARKYNVHIICVAHANKQENELSADATIGNLTKNDIAGTKNISNKADNIIAVERIFDADPSKPSMIMTSLKDRWNGARKVFYYKYDIKSGRFWNKNTSTNVHYDWRPTQERIKQWEKTENSPF